MSGKLKSSGDKMISQAIQTKYYGPTSKRGAYIIASNFSDNIRVRWDSDLSVDENHVRAAHTLFKKLSWNSEGVFLKSGILNEGVYVHVLCGSVAQGVKS